MSAPKVVGVGMMTIDDLYLVDELPVFGDSRRARATSRQCGGPAATAMAALARLGVSTRMIGKVGDDAEGDFLCDELRATGVDTGAVVRGRGATRTCAVFVDAATGDRGFLSRPEQFPPLAASDITPQMLDGAAIVHIDDADEAGVAAARNARERGQRVVFDGTWQSPHLAQFLPLTDVAIVSEFFADRLLPDADATAVLQHLLELGAETVVLTRGREGAVAATRTRPPLWCPAFPIQAVDTTGAGDAFHGGFIYAMLHDWSLDDSLRFASAVGALNCRQLGGQAGLPSLAEVEKVLAVPPSV